MRNLLVSAAKIQKDFKIPDKDLVSLMIERVEEGPLKRKLFKQLQQNVPIDDLFSEIQQEYNTDQSNRIEVERKIHTFNNLQGGIRKTCALVLDLVRDLGMFARDDRERKQIEENVFSSKILSLVPPSIAEKVLCLLEREGNWDRDGTGAAHH